MNTPSLKTTNRLSLCIGEKLRPIFAPAIYLLNRVGFTAKFTLLWLISATVITVILLNLLTSQSETIRTSQLELQGLKLIEPISRTVQLVQQYRRISAALLAGNKTISDRHAAKDKEVNEAFIAMAEKLPAHLTSSKKFLQIKTEWQRLHKEGIQQPADENFAANTRLIDQLQLFKESIADDYALTTDPEIAAVYMIDTTLKIFPQHLEYLGQLRAYGTGILTKKQISRYQEIKLYNLIAALDRTHLEASTTIEKAGLYSPALLQLLVTTHTGIDEAAQQIISLVKTDILTGNFVTPPETFLDMSTTAINNGYTKMLQVLLPAVTDIIEARISKAKNTIYLSIGTALLLLLLMVYISISIYYAIICSVNSLVQSARAFAEGDLNQRVKLDTHDEFNLVGDSLNAMYEARKLAEEKLQLSQFVSDQAFECIFWSDEQGRICYVNEAACRELGYTKAELLAMSLTDIDPDVPAVMWAAHWQELKQKKALIFETMRRRKDGSTIPVEASINFVQFGDSEYSIGYVRNITERKKAEENIHRLAFYDSLTQLPNRRLFQIRLQQAMKVSHRSGKHCAIIYVDVDHFKKINDTQGHPIGDLLLIEIAHRLQASIRACDSVARLGGDEFVIILEDLDHQPDKAAVHAELVAEKTCNELSQPYILNDNEHLITVSIGIELFQGQRENFEDLLKHADMAMYQAKEQGRNTIRFFDLQMQTALETHAAIEADLRQALAKQQLLLYYQVQVNSSGKATGAEVLLRWKHPERGFVFPDQFIPLAEETGLIVPIGLWVLQTACAQLKLWQNNPLTCDLTLAVNVSAKQFHQADFVPQVQRVLLESGAKPSHLKLELTESIVLVNIQDTIAKMREIKLLGVDFSMDDFGTGYSSLAYLKRLPLDQVKIDRSFVTDITSDASDAAIVQAIIAMTEALGLNVIAEGVETKEQQDFLTKHGCHAFQGYLFSKPVPVAEFEALKLL